MLMHGSSSSQYCVASYVGCGACLDGHGELRACERQDVLHGTICVRVCEAVECSGYVRVARTFARFDLCVCAHWVYAHVYILPSRIHGFGVLCGGVNVLRCKARHLHAA
jgi:hypothetical protein